MQEEGNLLPGKERHMNVLILGGLLLLAAAAIIGAILLGLSEQRAEGAGQRSAEPPVAQASPPPLITRQLGDEAAASSPVLSPREETTTTLPRSEQAPGRDQGLPSLNGQVHELADEIRALHQQAWQLEQRLSVLTEVMGHIENRSPEPLSFEEGAHPASSERTPG